MKNKNRFFAVPLGVLVPLAVHAQTSPDVAAARANAQQDQQVQQQRDAQQRAATVAAPAVRSDVPAKGEWPDLPVETPCFRIDTFALDVPATLPDDMRAKGASALPQDRFAFAREWLEHYRGQCVGKRGLDTLVKGVQQTILSRGYVTTRVMLPAQDLSGGALKLALIPGVIRKLGFKDATTRGTWKTAFPARDGDVLNLRDLEQGMEQMKRVSSQDATMELVAASVPGESDVEIAVARAKPWTFVASVDDSGTRETGSIIGTVTLGIDNLLGLNDILTAGFNQDLQFGDHGVGTHGWNGSYSIPWGYWTATLFGYTNTYYENVAGVNGRIEQGGYDQLLPVSVP
ncbi:MAG: ShlB/FhaC/HecB family hemolysin secretion/activation protein [Paraburkholderia tropica]|uniref:Hemolysin secretion/activation protein ShlB/FhaC/HecB n=1 Tax=Paraburkholderia tropica TaxID=92647 RepID=A0ABX5MV68_9BURK|nr:ShlB/FhaC/HecB family hemolysin secretion/activation protein [Paraburkholderia tropica]MDE1139217.1 ShlB/FhaC/HecB family hemolysin secretion/activation protein [Paraburkholderia tropica]PXX19663.1 hemolysin secretion/activation protein ShlB/FhaC/HecB [Paraburkholderia tropica]PZW88604.1 hemolysin secretion/activation protein ShlB/FhaC/HecB [Paraburkholderia tropica]